MRIKRLSPRRTRIREQDIHMVRCLPDLLNQVFHALDLGAVGRDGNGFRAGGQVGQGVEGLHGGVAGGGFAGCNVDLRSACLEEPADGIRAWCSGLMEEE